MIVEIHPCMFAYALYDSKDCVLPSISSLRDLCAQKLISDVCLLQNVSLLPPAIVSILFKEAVEKKRTLSVFQLVKYYPLKEFVLPLPDCLRSWNKLFSMKPADFEQEIKNVRERAWIILRALFTLISQENKTSKLCVVDFSDLPMDTSFAREVCSLISNQPERRLVPMRKYILKMRVTLTANHVVQSLVALKSQEEFSDIKLIITGLYFYNNNFAVGPFSQLIETIGIADMCWFSMRFAEVSDEISRTFLSLQKFKNLKMLSLSYMYLDFRIDSQSLHNLSCALYELVNLSGLRLQGCYLSDCVGVLLRKFCVQHGESSKKQKTESPRKCCILHRGSLEFIDFDDCHLHNEDLMCLTESPLADTLKYLNISNNKCDLGCLTRCLEAMRNSLELLLMDNCLPRDAFSHPVFPKLSSMMKLRCLSLLGLDGFEPHLEVLAQELQNMPSLTDLALPAPRNAVLQRNTGGNLRWLSNKITEVNQIKITWKDL